MANELIKIQEAEGKQTVNARDLWIFLEVGRDFSNWIKDKIERYGFVEEVDFIRFAKKGEANNATLIDYYLTIDMAKEISMVENSPKGQEARKYFIEVEKRYKETLLPKPQSLEEKAIEVLRALTAVVEEQKLQIQVMTPKVEYFDELVDKHLLTNFRDTSKELKIHESNFIEFLLQKGYIYRDVKSQLQPYAQYVPDLFEIKEWKSDKKAGTQTRITPKGRETFRILTKNIEQEEPDQSL